MIEYRTSSDERKVMSHKKLTYMMIDEDIVYLSASSVYRILKNHRLLGGPHTRKKAMRAMSIAKNQRMCIITGMWILRM